MSGRAEENGRELFDDLLQEKRTRDLAEDAEFLGNVGPTNGDSAVEKALETARVARAADRILLAEENRNRAALLKVDMARVNRAGLMRRVEDEGTADRELSALRAETIRLRSDMISRILKKVEGSPTKTRARWIREIGDCYWLDPKPFARAVFVGAGRNLSPEEEAEYDDSDAEYLYSFVGSPPFRFSYGQPTGTWAGPAGSIERVEVEVRIAGKTVREWWGVCSLRLTGTAGDCLEEDPELLRVRRALGLFDGRTVCGRYGKNAGTASIETVSRNLRAYR